MTIAVVIVAHGSGHWLRQCVESLQPSTLVSELVVVDNASPADDPGIAAVRQLSNADARVRLIANADNTGFGAAVNQGAAATTAPWLLVLNPDCVAAPAQLQTLLETAQSLPTLGVLGCQLVDAAGTVDPASFRHDPTLLRLISRWLGLHRLGLPDWSVRPQPTTLCEVANVSGALMLMPRSSFAAVNGFDPGYFLHFEDLDLCRRLRGADRRVFVSPVQVMHAKGTSSQRDPVAIRAHKLRSLRRYVARYDIPNAWLIQALARIAFALPRGLRARR